MQAAGSDRRWLDAAARLARAAIGASPGHSAAAAIIVDEELQLVFGRGVTGRAVPWKQGKPKLHKKKKEALAKEKEAAAKAAPAAPAAAPEASA